MNAFKRELGKSLPFLSPRLDGIREFAVTKELCSLYEQMESKQFDFYGNAEVNGNVAIGSNVWVNGNARIQSRDDLCTFGYFGSSNFYTTAFKIEGRGIGVCGYFEGTFDEFRNKVKKPHGINDYAVEDYLMIADLIENKLSGRSKK